MRKAQPHSSVGDSSFYKHIDPDLPESARAAQLLIWCASRAMDESIEAASSKSGKDPPLPEKYVQVLKEVEEEVIKMLAEKKIDTNVYSPAGTAPQVVKENEQNVKNRAREVKFKADIARCVFTVDYCLLVSNMCAF